VSCQTGLNRGLGGLKISNFADEKDVRVLPKHGTDNACERHPDFGFDLALVDAGQVVFDGVFGGDDLDVGPIQLVECGVESGGFARAGGTGNQEDSVWALDQCFEAGEVFVAEAEVLEADLDILAVEDSHDDGLTMTGWDDANAHVDISMRTPSMR
jgi:hypothetical protein